MLPLPAGLVALRALARLINPLNYGLPMDTGQGQPDDDRSHLDIGTATALLLQSNSEPDDRRLAARFFGDVAERDEHVQVESLVRPLVQAAGTEDTPEVLTEIMNSIGTLASPLGLTGLMSNIANASSEVRAAVAANLPFLVDESNALKVEEALIDLTHDDDAGVREWATLGVGSQLLFSASPRSFETSERSRAALRERAVVDTEPEVRGEALIGLARRSDPDTSRLVDAELRGYSVAKSTLRAAILLSDPGLRVPLERLRSWWSEDSALLDEALRSSA